MARNTPDGSIQPGTDDSNCFGVSENMSSPYSSGRVRVHKRGSIFSDFGQVINAVNFTELHDESYLADGEGTGASAVKNVVRNARQSIMEGMDSTMLNPQAREVLEEVAPGLLVWLTTMPGIFLEILVFVSFVAVDVAKGMSLSLAVRNPDLRAQGVMTVTSSLVLATSLAVILIGLMVGVLTDGFASLKQVVNIRGTAYRKFGGAAILYALAQIFCTLAYTAMAPGTIMILGQIRLLNTAVLSRFLLGRTYMDMQWCLMVIIIMGAVVHIWAQSASSEIHEMRVATMGGGQGEADAKGESDATVLSFIYLAIYFLTSDLATVVIEKSSKCDLSPVPFWLSVTTIHIVSLPITLVMSFVVPNMQALLGVDEVIWGPQMWWATADSSIAQNCLERTNGLMKCGLEAGGFWRDWDEGLIWLALTLSCLGAWGAGFIVKILSATTKKLAKVIVFSLVYFLGDCLLLRRPEDGPISVGAVLAAVQVMALTQSFFMLKSNKKAPVHTNTKPTLDCPHERASSVNSIQMEQDYGVHRGSTLLESLGTSGRANSAVSDMPLKKVGLPEVAACHGDYCVSSKSPVAKCTADDQLVSDNATTITASRTQPTNALSRPPPDTFMLNI